MTTASQRRNSAFVGGALKYGTLQDEFAAFDLLPETIRAALNEHAVKLAALSVLPHYGWAVRRMPSEKTAVALTFSKLKDLEESEIDLFATLYRGRWKAPYPHVGAEATIQRYVGAGIPRRRRRPMPPRRRGASDWLIVPTVA